MSVPLAANTQSNADQNMASDKHYIKSDKSMNAAYKKLMNLLDAKGKTHLKTAQTAWIKFRDAEADFLAYKSKDKPYEPTVRLTNLAGITDQRTKELQHTYSVFTDPGSD